MLEQQVIEIIKFSPVVGTLIYIISLMGRTIAERDKRINELIDRCINPCQEKTDASSFVDKDEK